MPKAKLPKEKGSMPAAIGQAEEAQHPTANIPATKEIVQTFAVGDEVTVTLKGKIMATSAYESKESSRADFTLAVEEVEAYSKGKKTVYEKMADEEDDEDE